MIEPTDEMVQAFRVAGPNCSCCTDDPVSGVRRSLAAVLAIVERDYILTPICNNELMPGVVCKRSAINPRHKHEGTLPNGSRAEWT